MLHRWRWSLETFKEMALYHFYSPENYDLRFLCYTQRNTDHKGRFHQKVHTENKKKLKVFNQINQKLKWRFHISLSLSNYKKLLSPIQSPVFFLGQIKFFLFFAWWSNLAENWAFLLCFLVPFRMINLWIVLFVCVTNFQS